MKAFSIGFGVWAALDQSTRGTEIISLSRRSLYCRAPAGIICIGNLSIGQGPINVVLSNPDWNDLHSSVVVGERLDFSEAPTNNNRTVLLSRKQTYAERIPPPRDFEFDFLNTASLWRIVSTYGKGPILNAVGNNSLASDSMDVAVAQREKRGLELLKAGWGQGEWCSSLTTAVKRLLGLGPGLTPSGDDLLVGYMSGLELMSFRSSRAREIKQILQSVIPFSLKSTNEISQSHLRWACAGYYMEPLTDLLKVIAKRKTEDIVTSMLKLLKTGASSGTDTAVGVLWALENGKEMQVGGN